MDMRVVAEAVPLTVEPLGGKALITADQEVRKACAGMRMFDLLAGKEIVPI